VNTLLTLLLMPFLTGIGATLLNGRMRPRRYPATLVLHDICERPQPHLSYVLRSRFEQMLQIIVNQSIQTVTIDKIEPTTTPSPHQVALTFDDGLESVYTHALPLLEHYALKATVFAISGSVNQLVQDVYGRRRHLSSAQLRELQQLGHCIGSHTRSHASLTHLSPGARYEELYVSKCKLQDILGAEVTTLSFPFGDWNPAVWEQARELGYQRATLYRGRAGVYPDLIEASGIYAFDSLRDIVCKILPQKKRCIAEARAHIMPHFAKGSALWQFKPEYRLPH
jgi:peptidoglycan/xylan/chitin deacetylase (PgdA/CDA1 family)